MNINKALICGRITKDLELKKTASGKSVLSFSIATNYKFKDTETTEFHNIVAWHKLAELIEKYLGKGDEVYIEGRIQTRSYEKDGKKVYRTEIVAEQMQFGQKKKGSEKTGEGKSNFEKGLDEIPEASKDIEESEIDVSDIPF